MENQGEGSLKQATSSSGEALATNVATTEDDKKNQSIGRAVVHDTAVNDKVGSINEGPPPKKAKLADSLGTPQVIASNTTGVLHGPTSHSLSVIAGAVAKSASAAPVSSADPNPPAVKTPAVAAVLVAEKAPAVAAALQHPLWGTCRFPQLLRVLPRLVQQTLVLYLRPLQSSRRQRRRQRHTLLRCFPTTREFDKRCTTCWPSCKPTAL
jgi:hypothetical protein